MKQVQAKTDLSPRNRLPWWFHLTPESCLKPNFLWIFQLCGLIPLSLLKPVKVPFLFTTKRILGYPQILSQCLKFHIAYLLVLIEEIKQKIANMLSTISPKVLCSLTTVIFIYLVIQFDIKHSKDKPKITLNKAEKSTMKFLSLYHSFYVMSLGVLWRAITQTLGGNENFLNVWSLQWAMNG